MASSSARNNESPSTGDDGAESAKHDLHLIKPNRMPGLRAPQVEMTVKFFLGDDNKAYVEFSGKDTIISYEQVDYCASLSNFRRFIGYSDQQHDDATAAHRSALRANPAQSANIDDPRAQLESHMTPSKPKCFHMVPHLLSPETALQCKDEDSIEKKFDLDHRGGFTVYKHPSYQFSVLDLYYYYKKAVEDEPVNRVSRAGFLAPVNPAVDSCTFDWDITAQAMDSYMEYHGFGSYTFIMVQPPSNKTTPRLVSSPSHAL